MLKCLTKGNNGVFGRCEQRSKVRRMDLAFKNLNIRRKSGKGWLKSNKKKCD